jgi:phage baseplate assembly protein W
MNPSFGCYIYKYLFEPLHPDVGRLIGAEIIRAVNEQEPRVEVKNVDMGVDYKNDAYVVKLEMVLKELGETVELVKILVRE